MKIREFQKLSTRTVKADHTKEQMIANMIFGANGEIGEVTDLLKKYLFQGHSLDVAKLEEELGDVMFYLVNLATIFNLDMENILDINIEKLKSRYPNGFESERSINRKE